MSTVAIVLIIAAAVLLAGLLVLAPRLRGRKHERELDRRRHEAADAQREKAHLREERADKAERLAREERERAREAEHRATLHEEGAADHELVGRDDDPRLVERAATTPDDNTRARY